MKLTLLKKRGKKGGKKGPLQKKKKRKKTKKAPTKTRQMQKRKEHRKKKWSADKQKKGLNAPANEEGEPGRTGRKKGDRVALKHDTQGKKKGLDIQFFERKKKKTLGESNPHVTNLNSGKNKKRGGERGIAAHCKGKQRL